jgi:trehalose 6-phosphate phosphatase
MALTPLPLSDFDISALHPQKAAFFLDFDGTLADFADDPAAVVLPATEMRSLEIIRRATDSAVAIVSGRSIPDLERLIAPLDLPMAGVHGLERKTARGEMLHVPFDEAGLQKARNRLRTFSLSHAGILMEEKSGSIALHYRKRPELETPCMATARAVADENPGLKLLHGKMVIEIKAGHATKADAIRAFMQEEPFRGRHPLFAGDDATDEDAFPVVETFGGTSIKVGQGATRAAYRAADIDEFRSWLNRAARRFEDQSMRAQAGGHDGGS